MEQEHDSPFIDLGDNTALVCVDHQQYQKIVVPQLIDMTYKVHLGLFEEDVILKLKTYNYDVVVIYENFKGSTLQTNPILARNGQAPGRATARTFRHAPQPPFCDQRCNERIRAECRPNHQHRRPGQLQTGLAARSFTAPGTLSFLHRYVEERAIALTHHLNRSLFFDDFPAQTATRQRFQMGKNKKEYRGFNLSSASSSNT